MSNRRKFVQTCDFCGDKVVIRNSHYNTRFCSRACYIKYRAINIREKSDGWKGGEFTANGYVYVYKPDHPKCMKNGYVKRNRLIAESIIGRLLNDDEVVHHKNMNKSDDSIDNLEIMSSSKHASLHASAPRFNRRICELYDSVPKEVLVGKYIHVGKAYRKLLGKYCASCGKPIWARTDKENASYCSRECSWVIRKTKCESFS